MNIEELRKDFESENEIPEYMKYNTEENMYRAEGKKDLFCERSLKESRINMGWLSWIKAYRKYCGR